MDEPKQLELKPDVVQHVYERIGLTDLMGKTVRYVTHHTWASKYWPFPLVAHYAQGTIIGVFTKDDLVTCYVRRADYKAQYMRLIDLILEDM